MDDIDFSIKTGNVIAYCPAFLKIKCDTKFVLFLSQILYWSSRTKYKDGWFYKTQEEWEKELGLTAIEQKRVREILKAKGLLEEKIKGLPRKIHFRLNKSKLSKLLKDDAPEEDVFESNSPLAPVSSHSEGFPVNGKHSQCKTSTLVSRKLANKSLGNLDTSVQETSTLVSGKPVDKCLGNLETSIEETSIPIYTEITTETTTEITAETTPETTTKITPENKSLVTQARPGGEQAKRIEKIFMHWKQTMNHPNAKLDIKRKALITKSLVAGYSEQALCEAISGCAKTPHNMGDNDRGQRYDGLHIILRDADQIDRFISNYHSPPRRITKADRLTQDNFNAVQSWLTEDDEFGAIYESE